MKKVVMFFGLAATGLLAFVNVSAQTFTPNYGDNPALCQRNLSIYQMDYQQQTRLSVQQRNFDEVIVFWRRLWNDCPLSSPNLTLHGAVIYKHYIDRELNPERRTALIDTLMQVWEKGISLRADNPQTQVSYQTQMMQDLLRYTDASENEDRLLSLLRNIMASQREATSAATYAHYMNIRFAQNREGRLSDEELLDDYNTVSDALSVAISAAGNEELARARDLIDDLFVNSAAASRENLLNIYGARYEDNKDNQEFLSRLTRLLSQKEYTDTELFENASERLYELNPSADAAHAMAMLFFRRENFERAILYFEEAIANATTDIDKARFNYTLGGIMLTRFNNYRDARRYTLEAIRLRPDWGQPLILLANIYASGPRCGEDAFEQAYVFWVAVDKLQTARRVDSDLASTIDPLIRSYSQHFPRREEAFFRGLSEGTTVTVGCWINESTRARFNN